jgi:hypothetical protein
MTQGLLVAAPLLHILGTPFQELTTTYLFMVLVQTVHFQLVLVAQQMLQPTQLGYQFLKLGVIALMTG